MQTRFGLLLIALSGASLATCAASPALADDEVHREYRFKVDDIEEIEIRASVGSIEILPTDGDEIELSLDIRSQHDGWFRFGHRDVDDVELESRVRGERLILRQTEDDTNTDWVIRMPRVARTDIKLGVGDIDAEFVDTELDIDLGVGDVDVEFPKDAAGRISLDVGVGDAKLRGTRDIESRRSFVSQEIDARGDGEQHIRVHVGVGDIDLSLF